MVSSNRSKQYILLVDNDPDFLDTRAEFLQRAGYQVLKAGHLKLARQLMDEAHTHLAILDIRMVDDDDDRDSSGLILAKDAQQRGWTRVRPGTRVQRRAASAGATAERRARLFVRACDACLVHSSPS